MSKKQLRSESTPRKERKNYFKVRNTNNDQGTLSAKEKYDPKAAKEKRRQATLKRTHMSSFQSICISCTRWGNNPHVIKSEKDIETKFPKGKTDLFFLPLAIQHLKKKWFLS